MTGDINNVKKIFNKEEGQSFTDKDVVNKIFEHKDEFPSFNIKLEKNENNGFYVKEIEKLELNVKDENNISANSSNNENKVISVGNLNYRKGFIF